MTRYLKLSLIALLAVMCIAPIASAHRRVIVGGYFGPAYYWGHLGMVLIGLGLTAMSAVLLQAA